MTLNVLLKAAVDRSSLEAACADAGVKPGKAPGAFAHPTVTEVHPYVMLNYLGKPRDVMTLAHAFAVNMAAELRHSYFPGFSPRAASALLKHDWPGNVRELKNTVERSVYRAQDPERPISRIAFDPFDSPYKLQGREGGEKEPAGPRRAPLLPADLPRRLLDTEKELLLAALDKARFNQRMAADLLNLSYHQFRGKLKKHSISGRPAS